MMSLKYVSSICHRILGIVLLCSLAREDDDPCVSYKELRDPTRSQFHSIAGLDRVQCDKGLALGWYRFKGRAGLKMPESCVKSGYCGTHSSGWFQGSHPTKVGEVTTGRVCFNFMSSCCEWDMSAKVKKCNGFYVYQLSPTLYCDLHYCGDGATDLDCAADNNDIIVNGSTPGSLSSPNFPRQYPNSLQCTWRITAPADMRVKLVLKNLTLGPNDYITFRDGNRNNSEQIANYTGSASGELRLFTSDRYMLVNFVSDGSEPGIGFQLNYESVVSECGWAMTALSGTFWSPYYPSHYKSRHFCKWRIYVPGDYTISVTFEDVILQPRCCQCDYVALWETLSNGSAVLIGKVCDATKPDPSYQFKSTGNNMTVIFHSDTSFEAQGFKASYKAIPGPAATTTSTRASTGTRPSTTKPSYVTTTADRTTSTALNSNGTSPSTTLTKPSSVATTKSTTSKVTTVVIEQNGTTTPETTTSRDTSSESSFFTEETFRTKNKSAAKGSSFVIFGMIGPVFVIGGVLAGFRFCKKRNIEKNNNNKSKLAVRFTSSDHETCTFGMTNILYEGWGDEPIKESDNPMYGRDFHVASVKAQYIDEDKGSVYFGYESVKPIKESDNPMYGRDSHVASVKVQYTDEDKGSVYSGYESVEPIKESDNPMYGRDRPVASVKSQYIDEDKGSVYSGYESVEPIKKIDNTMYGRDSPVVSAKAQYINEDNGSENVAYESDNLETSPKERYEEAIKQSENPLYASSSETVKQSENPVYDSMNDNVKGTVDDGIYSSLD